MADGPLLGQMLELDVGAVAHGGFCVARHEGRVVFVRHALPGERVRARITEDRGGSYARADAVQIVTASPDRVEAPCRYAGPGRCGGCDWQHVSARRQRDLKAEVIIDQFRRLADLEVAHLLGSVRELEGGLLGWRTRITYAVDGAGHPGLHRHRSESVLAIDSCALGVAGVGDADVLRQSWAGLSGVEVSRGDDGAVAVLAHRPGAGRQARGRRPPDRVEVIEGPQRLVRDVDGNRLSHAADGFWQVHPGAATAFVRELCRQLDPRPGDTVLDLYCGAGALTAVLAEAVGETGNVLGIETDAGAVADAIANLSGKLWAAVRRGRIDAPLLDGLDVTPDLVVLDPPRSGAGREVMAALLAMGARAVGYVACDPAALARDTAAAVAAGWQLSALAAFDAFPMTHHVECIATFTPAT